MAVILKAGHFSHLRNQKVFSQQLGSAYDSSVCDVFIQGKPSCFLENLAQVVFVDVEMVGKAIKRELAMYVFVNIDYNGLNFIITDIDLQWNRLGIFTVKAVNKKKNLSKANLLTDIRTIFTTIDISAVNGLVGRHMTSTCREK